MYARDQRFTEDENPKWTYWRQLKTVSLEEAILLSLNINPNLIPWKLEESQLFWDSEIAERTEVAYSWSVDSDCFASDVIHMPIRDRVNLAKFGLWASQIMGWKNIPTELLKIASFAASVAEGGAVALTPKPKSQRQENNDLRLIWALRTMLSDNDIYPKNTQLIDDLCELHKGKEPFKKSTLETRFSDARKISESD